MMNFSKAIWLLWE